MADGDGKDGKRAKGFRTEIVVALIGLVAATVTGVLSNWDKLFPETQTVPPVADTTGPPTEDATETAMAGLPAPAPRDDRCDVTIPRPPDTHYLLVGWQPVAEAATYTVEFDCFGCREHGRTWHSLEAGAPWHVRTGLGLRSPIYSSKIHAEMREAGGMALRWRVWAVDHDGREGAKSRWCKLSFVG